MERRVQPQLEVMDLPLVCQSFPRAPVPEIPRDNILNTIERTFEGDVEVVMIEGGVGLVVNHRDFDRLEPLVAK